MKQVSVLFVCMGNICRSPTAEGMFAQLVAGRGLDGHIRIDSAGTHAYHIGEPPDKRSQAAALMRGLDLSRLRARQVQREDFEQFDYILAMDHANLRGLQASAPPKKLARVHLFMEFASRWTETEVPDPYYGGSGGFERVLDMVEDASEGLLEHLLKHSA